MSDIPITGVPSTLKTPGSYIEVVPGQGPSTSGGGVREALYVMPKTSAGTGVVNTLYSITNESQIIDYAGPGSMAHRAVRRHLRANSGGKVWVVLYAASSGGSPAAATGTITFTTAATSIQTARITVSGEVIEVRVNNGDAIATVATNVANAINVKTHLPYTASPAAGVVTLTAKIMGASQGTGALGRHRFRAEITSGAMTVATSGAHLGTAVAGADGTTTEAANFATALAVVANRRFYYIGTSLDDATSLASLRSHLVTKSEPVQGLRSKGYAGYTGTLANVTTLATTLNYERTDIIWQKNSEEDPATLVGNAIGVYQKFHELDTAYNFDGTGLTPETRSYWLVPKAYDPADWPSGGAGDQNDAITDGITCIASSDAGSYIVMSVTTRSKNAAGSVDDFRATEAHRMSVADEVADTHNSRHLNTYGGFKLKNDRKLSNGKPDPNQPKLPKVTTPYLYKPFVGKILREFEEAAKLQEVDSSIAGMKTNIDPLNTGRLECGYDIRVIDHFHQMTARIAEVSPG